VITETRVSTLCFPKIKLVICGKYLQNSDPVRGSLDRRWSFKQGLTVGAVGAQIDHNTLAGDYVTGAANWRRLGREGVASGCPRTTERGSGPATWRGRGSKAGNRGAWTEKLSKEDLGWRRSAVADADCRAEGSPDCSRRSGAGRPAADAPAHAPDRVDRPSPHNRTRQRCCCIAVSCAAAHHRSPAGCRTQVRCREMQFCEPQPGPLHNDCCLLGYWVDAMLPVGLGGMVGIGQVKFWPNSLLPICLP
jgi:hypothetical protein